MDTSIHNYQVVDHNQIDRTKWQEYVDNHEFGTVFHSPYLFDVYQMTKKIIPYVLFVLNDNKEIKALSFFVLQSVYRYNIGVFTKRIVFFNTPIYDSIEALDILLDVFSNKFKKKAVYVEMRNHYDTTNHRYVFEKYGFVYEPHLNILVNTQKSEVELFNEMSSRRRKEVKHAISEGLYCDTVYNDIEYVYDIIKGIYKRAKLPLIDKSFFRAIYIDKSRFEIRGVYINNQLIGAVLLLLFKDTVYGLYGGSKAEYFTKRPNDLLFWNVILWAKENGYKCFDWMGAGHPDKPYGIRDWKKQFGGYFVNHGRYVCYYNKGYFYISKFVFDCLRKLQKKIEK